MLPALSKAKIRTRETETADGYGTDSPEWRALHMAGT